MSDDDSERKNASQVEGKGAKRPRMLNGTSALKAARDSQEKRQSLLSCDAV